MGDPNVSLMARIQETEIAFAEEVRDAIMRLAIRGTHFEGKSGNACRSKIDGYHEAAALGLLEDWQTTEAFRHIGDGSYGLSIGVHVTKAHVVVRLADLYCMISDERLHRFPRDGSATPASIAAFCYQEATTLLMQGAFRPVEGPPHPLPQSHMACEL